MDGMYKILSATTNPTGKNKLEAGKNGMHKSPRPTRMICGPPEYSSTDPLDVLVLDRPLSSDLVILP